MYRSQPTFSVISFFLYYTYYIIEPGRSPILIYYFHLAGLTRNNIPFFYIIFSTSTIYVYIIIYISYLSKYYYFVKQIEVLRYVSSGFWIFYPETRGKKIMFSLMNLEDGRALKFVFLFETRMYYNMGMR